VSHGLINVSGTHWYPRSRIASSATARWSYTLRLDVYDIGAAVTASLGVAKCHRDRGLLLYSRANIVQYTLTLTHSPVNTPLNQSSMKCRLIPISYDTASSPASSRRRILRVVVAGVLRSGFRSRHAPNSQVLFPSSGFIFVRGHECYCGPRLATRPLTGIQAGERLTATGEINKRKSGALRADQTQQHRHPIITMSVENV